MKKSVMALTVLLLPFAHAGEFAAEPSATVYWQVPLAASQTGGERHVFGLRMDQVVRDQMGNLVSSFSAPLSAPAVDFRFTDKGLNGVYVHGVNMSTPAIAKAAGGDTTVWWIVGGTIAGMAGLAIWADDQGGSSCPPVKDRAFATGCEVVTFE